MPASMVTRKGQVTIPKTIRDRLKIKEGEKIVFTMRGDEVVLKVLRGSILDLKGSVKPSAHPEDFDKIRHSVKQIVSGKLVRHG